MALPAAMITGIARAARRPACPAVYAHTGLHYPYVPLPENSLAAVDAAVNAGADGTEADARFSSDNNPVIMHDATVNRTTTWHGAVRHYRTSALIKMRLTLKPNTEDPTSQHVPTLYQYLERVKMAHANVEIEVKPAHLTTAQLGKFVQRFRETDAWSFATVSSFSPATLGQVARADARFAGRTALLTGSPVPDDTDAQEDVAYRNLASAGVASLHAAGLRVDAWTPETPAAWKSLAAMGVDEITTNDINGYLASVCR
jgi:glycerophosphoryl diester phosphodiesterase